MEKMIYKCASSVIVAFVFLLCSTPLASAADECVSHNYAQSHWDNVANANSVVFGVDCIGGSIFVAGQFTGSFVIGGTTYTSNGSSDIFLSRLGMDGSHISTITIGGSGGDHEPHLVVGPGADNTAGNADDTIYLAGSYFGANVDFNPAGTAVTRSSFSNTPSPFLVRYTRTLTTTNARVLTWAVRGDVNGISMYDAGTTESVNISGQFFEDMQFQMTGRSADMDPTAGTDMRNYPGDPDQAGVDYQGDATLIKMNYNTSTNTWSYGWGRLFGSTGNDRGQASATDSAGDVFVVGGFRGTVDFDADLGGGTTNRTSAGGTDAYIVNYNSSGTFQWVGTAGGTGDDYAEAVGTTNSNNAVFTGAFSGTADLDPTTGGTQNRTSSGAHDIFIIRVGTAGGFKWANNYGSTNEDFGMDVESPTGTNDVVAIGMFQGTVDFDIHASRTENRSSNSSRDVYRLLINDNSTGTQNTLRYAYTYGGTGSESVLELATYTNASSVVNSYTAGSFLSATVDFDPTSGTDTHTKTSGAGLNNGFLQAMYGDFAYQSIGFRYYRTSTGTEEMAAQCDLTSNLRVRRSGTTYGIDLLSATFTGTASKFGVRDDGVTKRARLCIDNCTPLLP